MIYVAIALLVTAVVAGWLMTLFSLPGNWVIAGAAALYAWLAPPDSGWSLGWIWVAVLVGLALVGEGIEFVAGALGVRRRGGSMRGAALAIVGSVMGAMAGLLIGAPVPFLGSIVGVVLGASLGALIGAMLGESWKGKSVGESWLIGQGAFWGRLFGTLAKTAVGALMAVIALAALALNLVR